MVSVGKTSVGRKGLMHKKRSHFLTPFDFNAVNRSSTAFSLAVLLQQLPFEIFLGFDQQ